MNWLKTLIARMAGLFRKQTRDRQLDHEMRAHLELLADEYVRRGMNPQDARRAARRDFGGLEQMKEAYRQQSVLQWVDTLIRDVRSAVRLLRRSPGFTVAVISTLTLGLAAFTAVFSITESILWKPLPFPDSERLVIVFGKNLTQPRGILDSLTVPEYLRWKSANITLNGMAAFHWPEERNLRAGDRFERVRSAAVTQDFFSLLRVQPALGRDFPAGEDSAQRSAVILSYPCWQRLFGADRGLSGKTIQLENEKFTVVGVTPPGLVMEFLLNVDVYTVVSFAPSAARDRLTRGLEVLGRLRPGATEDEAQSDFSSLAGADASAFPATDSSWGAHVENLRRIETHYYQSTLLFFLTAALVVLAIACANAANLLLARLLRRQPELALRVSLGAGRWALVRQILIESICLAAPASVCGLLLAHWGLRLFVGFASPPQMEIPRVPEIGIDLRAFGIAALAALAAALTAGIPSARMASHVDPQDALKAAGRGSPDGSSTARFRDALIVAELSLCLVLLVGAGLFVDSLVRLDRMSPGFDPQHLLTTQVSLRGPQYTDQSRVLASLNGLLERVRVIPGVESAEIGSSLPLMGADEVRFTIDGKSQPATGAEPESLIRAVSTDYLSTLKIPVLHGRAFDRSDLPTSMRVAIVNENFARHFFAGEEPIGRTFKIVASRDAGQFLPGEIQIVGVAANTKEVGLDEVDFDGMYVPILQNAVPNAMLAVRTANGSAAVATGLRSELAALDPNQPPYEIVPMEQRISASLAQNRLHMMLASVFAVAALFLSSIGIYAVLSYSIAQRIREIGIRMALGAQRSGVLALVLFHSLRLLLPSLAVGLALTLVLGRLLNAMLYLVRYEHNGLIYGVSTRDPLLLTAAVLFLVTLAFLASLIPARRATQVDPMIALRNE